MEGPDLLTRFRDHLIDCRLFGEPGAALVAVSGGSDSVALLHLLRSVVPELGLSLTIGHIDHGIAADSGAWADVVRALADRLELPVRCTSLGLGPGASETVARQARYRALRGIQHDIGARYLVTAHQADDQVETVCYRFLRGSGPAGLAGIPDRGPGGLRRPLLPFTREELAAWLRSADPDGVLVADPANADTRHDRVWIRHNLLPCVRERWGDDVDTWVRRGAADALEDRHAWSAVLRALPEMGFTAAKGVAEVARVPLQRYDETLSVALLRAAAREVGCPLGAARAHRLLDFSSRAESGRVMQLGRGWVGEIAFDRLRILGPPERPSDAAWGGEDRGRLAWGEWDISWKPEPAGTATRGGAHCWTTPGQGVVRVWRPGDRMKPHGGVGRRKVRRLLMEARVPRSDRAVHPLLVRDGDILWIPGICRSDAALPRPGEPALRVDARRTRDPEADRRP